jgi:hypothetical protein
MKKMLICLLLSLAALPAWASRPAQYCVGRVLNPVTGKKVAVSYVENKDVDDKISSLSVSVGDLRKSLAAYESNQLQATIEINPAGKGEVVVAKRAAEELLVVLQRQGSKATLTFLYDQNLMLSNVPLKCSSNDDV